MLKELENENACRQKCTDEEKRQYIEKAPIGTLVAFQVNEKIHLSGAIVSRDCSKRRLEVETRKGARYSINFEQILWVKTGERWPREVYKLLFGGRNHEQKSSK